MDGLPGKRAQHQQICTLHALPLSDIMSECGVLYLNAFSSAHSLSSFSRHTDQFIRAQSQEVSIPTLRFTAKPQRFQQVLMWTSRTCQKSPSPQESLAGDAQHLPAVEELSNRAQGICASVSLSGLGQLTPSPSGLISPLQAGDTGPFSCTRLMWQCIGGWTPLTQELQGLCQC